MEDFLKDLQSDSESDEVSVNQGDDTLMAKLFDTKAPLTERISLANEEVGKVSIDIDATHEQLVKLISAEFKELTQIVPNQVAYAAAVNLLLTEKDIGEIATALQGHGLSNQSVLNFRVACSLIVREKMDRGAQALCD